MYAIRSYYVNEIEMAVLIEELDGADTEVAELAHRLGDGLADDIAVFRVQCP